jgi:hypothetical protein
MSDILSLILLAAAAVLAFFPRRRWIIACFALALIWELFLLFVMPGLLFRLAIDQATPEQQLQGFVGGVRAVHDIQVRLWYALFTTVASWPLLFFGYLRSTKR